MARFKKGEHRSPNTEFKKGQVALNKGKRPSEEAIKKQTKSWMNTFLSNPEMRKKMSESHKGKTPYNKGKKASEETKMKNRLAHLGKHLSPETRKKLSESHKGIPRSEEHRRNLSEALKGKPSPMKGKHQSEEWKRKIGLSNLGKRRTEEEKLKMGEAVKKAYSNPELRERMSEAHKGKKASEETKLKLKEHRAKQVFPIKDSKPELKIQGFLNELGIVFLKHKNMAIKHSYQCDIFIPLMNLIIEIDGDYWHGNQNNPRHKILNKHQIEQREEDNIRTKELQEKGFRVLRLWESDIKKMSLKDFSKALNLY